MIKRYLHELAAVIPSLSETERVVGELKAALPSRVRRRMTTLGILLNHVLKDMTLDEETAVVYTSAFSETGALEQYLDSLPFASPVGFQTSIHPSGIEQGLIQRKQPIGPLFPIAGEGNLFVQGVQLALSLPAGRVVLCGGEERGNWTLQHGLSASRTFAFALQINADPEGCIAEIVWEPESRGGAGSTSNMLDNIASIERREPLFLASPDSGDIMIQWL